MREFIDVHSVSNTLRMSRVLDKRSFLIVEGSDDECFFRTRCEAISVAIHIAHGKENAVCATRILNAEGFNRLLCVVDADFMRLDGQSFPEPNILWTDGMT